jgi:hypothetical protein
MQKIGGCEDKRAQAALLVIVTISRNPLMEGKIISFDNTIQSWNFTHYKMCWPLQLGELLHFAIS